MININGNLIATDEEFREHFDLEAIAAQAFQLSRDRDIFVAPAEVELLGVLSASLAGESACVGVDPDGVLCVACGNAVAPVKYALPGGVAEEMALSQDCLVRLIVSELGHRPYEARLASEGVVEDVKPLTLLTDGQTATLECFDPARDDAAAPLVNGIYLNTGSAKAAVSIVSSTFAEQMVLLPGEAVALLTKGGRYVSAHRLRAESSVLLLRRVPAPRRQTLVECFRRNSSTPCCSHTFDAATLIDAWPDENNGFVALVDGRILTYSSVIQPDDVDDLELPAGETPVKIAVRGRMLVALTDVGRVYTNIASALNGLQGVVDITIDGSGALTAIESAAYTPQPLNDTDND